MSFKSKTVGIIAGTALTLSIASGAMAQNTTATLTDNTGCSAGSLSGIINLGSWKWNGSGYVPVDSASGSVKTGIVDNQSFDGGTCNITVSFGDLTGQNQPNPQTIAAGNMNVTVVNSSGEAGSGYYTVNDGVALELTATFNGNANNYQPDVYGGIVTLGTVNSNG